MPQWRLFLLLDLLPTAAHPNTNNNSFNVKMGAKQNSSF
jgi:hypothetical protein